MDTPDGPIYESNAIARYVCRKGDRGLLGGNDYEQSQVDQWIEWSRSKIEEPSWTLIAPTLGYVPFDQVKHDKARDDFKKIITILNSHLEHQQYMVGTRVTLADIVLFVSLQSCVKNIFDPEYVKPFPHFVAWILKLGDIPHFKDSVGGAIKFAEKEAPPKAQA